MSRIQSVMFPKDTITAKEARHWMDKYDLPRLKRADITKNYRRYRVLQPSDKKMYRTITLSKDKGIKAVIEIPKKK